MGLAICENMGITLGILPISLLEAKLLRKMYFRCCRMAAILKSNMAATTHLKLSVDESSDAEA